MTRTSPDTLMAWYHGADKQEGVMASKIKRNRIAFRASDDLARCVADEARCAGVDVAALIHAAVVAHLEAAGRLPAGPRYPVPHLEF
jgi:hypothetical protein